MKILVLLLIVSTPNLVVCDNWQDVDFSPQHLQSDLEAIENYFNKIKNDIYAFVHWPNGITFVVSHYNKHLKIEGIFTDESCQDPKKDRDPYDALYFKQGNFYVTKPKMPSMKMISKDTPLCYFQTEVPKENQYLSIRYFSMEEIRDMIQQSTLSKYYSYIADSLASTYYYLAITPGFHHFVEYNICRHFYKPPGADGKLRVLVSTEKDPKILSKSVEAKMLQLGTPTPTLTINPADGEWPLANVFGVRMATIGFLAEVKGSKVKRFNTDDLSSDQPIKHVISASDFLVKARQAEPKHKNPDTRVCRNYENRPTSGYFHILGHILEKRVHFVRNEKDKDCPLIIEHANNNGYFLYDNDRVEKFCSSDSELWITRGGERVTLNQDITLVYKE